jgi:hypothetical protein
MENRNILRFKNLDLRIKNKKYIYFIGITLISVLMRILPHIPNVAPITGLALFSGATLKSKKALLIPLLTMFLSDIFLGFHSTILFVYGSFLLIAIIGRFIKNRVGFINLSLFGVLSSVLFFLITNFGVWLTSSMYVKNINGLISSYVMGIPFLKNTIIGDFIYTMSFFYGYKLFLFFSSKIVLLHRNK